MKDLTPRTALFLLALACASSGPAFALRKEGPGDSPPLLDDIRAGLEEAQVRQRVEEALQRLVQEANRGFALELDVWRANYPDELHLLLQAFLDHPDPRPVGPQVRGFLDRIDAEIVRPLLKIGDP